MIIAYPIYKPNGLAIRDTTKHFVQQDTAKTY